MVRSFTLLSALLVLVSATWAQDFSIGKYDTMRSEKEKEQRTPIVQVPDGYKNSGVRYPVRWQMKPPITVLLETRSAEAVAEICRKQATLKEPEYNISEEAINTLGYEMIAQKKVADAAVLLQLNVDLYPKSDNVYDSYGEVLLLQGKKEEAIKAYRRAVELNPNNTNARRVLEKLRQ
jgi:tetratricopeptide (TPR) repeat protein